MAFGFRGDCLKGIQDYYVVTDLCCLNAQPMSDPHLVSDQVYV